MAWSCWPAEEARQAYPQGTIEMHVTQVFARYAADFRRQDLPAEVLHHAKRAVIDWYASLFPGLGAAPVRQL
jgi:hypothetical protein